MNLFNILSSFALKLFETRPSVAIYLSEAGDEEFHEFYLHNLRRPMKFILNSQNNECCYQENLYNFRFEYLRRNVRNLLLGVESVLFPFDNVT